MSNIQDLTLAEIVSTNYKAAEVFEKFDLDFCCKGKRSLREACEIDQIPMDEIVRDLNDLYDAKSDIIARFNAWDLHFLVDFIVKNHHDYVRSADQRLLFYTQKIAMVHGIHHPELAEVEELFAELSGEMEVHMRKEEFMLFNYIKKLENAIKTGASMDELGFGSVSSPISRMEDEHEEAGKIMFRIRELTNHYNPPADACNTYRITLQELDEYERDLHQHIHLENNILFPKALLLENEIISARSASKV
jgi:regulator of cell morphogenesis and NO signaling